MDDSGKKCAQDIGAEVGELVLSLYGAEGLAPTSGLAAIDYTAMAERFGQPSAKVEPSLPKTVDQALTLSWYARMLGQAFASLDDQTVAIWIRRRVYQDSTASLAKRFGLSERTIFRRLEEADAFAEGEFFRRL